MSPATLDRDGIAMRIPHAGRMCLLDRLDGWTVKHVRCSASSHRDAMNPLRLDGRLHAANAIEYASQAMALHASLAAAPDATPTPGFLASVRDVRATKPYLDDVPGRITVSAELLAGDATQAMYRFALNDEAGALLVEGRATVILNALP
jgi:predicted hotdog family 3-hydroxylacyl-ACP dehydratase